jgi:hypothetical protein
LQHFAGAQKPPTQRHVGEKCGIIAAKRNAPARERAGARDRRWAFALAHGRGEIGRNKLASAELTIEPIGACASGTGCDKAEVSIVWASALLTLLAGAPRITAITLRPPSLAEATTLKPELHTKPVFMPSAFFICRINILRLKSRRLPIATYGCWK